MEGTPPSRWVRLTAKGRAVRSSTGGRHRLEVDARAGRRLLYPVSGQHLLQGRPKRLRIRVRDESGEVFLEALHEGGKGFPELPASPIGDRRVDHAPIGRAGRPLDQAGVL